MVEGLESLPPGSIPVVQGQVLAGKYRVDRVLGVGGMGVVVAATHLQLDQKVALKFMLPGGLAHPGLVERFAREARAAVRLKSDHVARVLDVGTLESGSPYMVMEFLEGDDLGSIVGRDGPMPVAAAVDCVLQACDAVAEAHALGIVHRDLKPRNLFLTRRNDGRPLVKVLDFGISKDRTGTGAGDLSLTRTHEVLGSPNYMSPEQLKSSKAADERSDIWALGVILFELLTGRVPFLAESVTQLTAMVLTETPHTVDQIRPEVPKALAAVVARCLQKERSARFASVAELAAALEPYAPADTRELAARIGRIAGASGARVLAQSSGTRIAVTGATSVNWSGKTELASARGRSAVVVGAIALGVLVAGAGAVVFVVHSKGASRAAAGPGTGAATAAATVSTSDSASAPAPLPPASASAVATAVALATVSATPVLPASASSAPPGVHAPPRGAAAAPASPTAGGSALEPPKYRTSW